MARQKEREILSESANGNLHLAEERMQTPQEDKDESNRYEEMKYSGVYRAEDQQNFKQNKKKKENPHANGGFQKGANL